MSRVLAILGGCGGIGRGLVDQAQAAGYTSVIFDLANSIAAHAPDGVRAVAVDATSPDSLIEAAANLSGPLAGFVNLCGFTGAHSPIVAQDVPGWTEVINGNLNAAFFAAHAFAPHIGQGGAIVNIGSGLGHFARPGYGPYAVSKAGIAALTRQMALELAPDVRVNCVAPSAVDTAFLRGGTGRSNEDDPMRLDLDSYARAIPMGRVATAQDVTGPILFLLSDAAAYVTGQTLHVNGGAFMP
jgi:3-oxoacyl-[acyl-carrier protein] reductase